MIDAPSTAGLLGGGQSEFPGKKQPAMRDLADLVSRQEAGVLGDQALQ